MQASPPKQAVGKMPVPGLLVLLLHLGSTDLFLQKVGSGLTGQLAGMNGHSHAVACQRRDHAGRVAEHEDVILDLLFGPEGNIGNGERGFESLCFCEKCFESRVFPDDFFFESLETPAGFHLVVAGQIGDVDGAVLYFHCSSIAAGKVVKCYQIGREISFQVKFNAEVIGRFPEERTVEALSSVDRLPKLPRTTCALTGSLRWAFTSK
jgi:hypothetical protein